MKLICLVVIVLTIIVLTRELDAQKRKHHSKSKRYRPVNHDLEDLFNVKPSRYGKYGYGRRRRNFINRKSDSYLKLVLNRQSFTYWPQTYSDWSNWTSCQPIDCVKTRFKECKDDSWRRYVRDFKSDQKCPVKFLYERIACNETEGCFQQKEVEKPSGNVTIKTLPSRCGIRSDRISNKIYGGKEAKFNSWPWHVGLYVVGRHTSSYICGGTLINSGWMVTAAHCLTTVKRLRFPLGKIVNTKERGIQNVFKVVIGTHNRDKHYKVSKLSHFILHPEFIANYAANIYDVALLKLESPVEQDSRVDFACVPPMENYTLPQNAKCYSIGWGMKGEIKPFDFWSYEFSWIFDRLQTRQNYKERDQDSLSKTLQEVELPLVNFEMCSRVYRLFNLQKKTHICAGRRGKDSCRGDSGGGLFCLDRSTNRWQLYGVTSFGSARGCGTSYGVYVRTAAIADWIKSTLF